MNGEGLFTEKGGHCCSELMCCIMGISSLEGDIFSSLEKKGSVEDIANEVKCSRSSAQRALKNLNAYGLVERQRLRNKHGKKYEYNRIVKTDARNILLRRLDTRYKELETKILVM